MEDRYDRQMRIPGWGIAGQKILRSKTVLVAGAGGLGSSSSMLLTSAGIGHLKIVDRDVVEPTNLNRQLLHWQGDVGSSKVGSALTKLCGLNPDVTVEAIEVDIGKTNVGSLLAGVDGIVDALDNFETRYLLNREAIRLGMPLFHGSIYGLEGRATTIIPGKTPCLRCIYESGPKPGVFPVAGPVPSVIGSIQALEVIKYFLGIGNGLYGRLLIFDGEDMVFSEIAVERNPNCPDCRDLRPSV
jgi:adenylyltransferase/sulfurtransferase